MANENDPNSARRGRQGAVSQLWRFIASNRKWWLVPILVVVLGVGVLLILGGTGAAPFIYTLF